MKKFVLTAKEHLKFPEYHVLNWLEGQRYDASEIDGEVLRVESETGPFFFSGWARDKLPECFDIEEVSA